MRDSRTYHSIVIYRNQYDEDIPCLVSRMSVQMTRNCCKSFVISPSNRAHHKDSSHSGSPSEPKPKK